MARRPLAQPEEPQSYATLFSVAGLAFVLALTFAYAFGWLEAAVYALFYR